MPPRKKSGKGRERKLKRKQEQVEAAALLAKIQAAYEMGDHMSGLPAFRRFNRNGVDLKVSFHRQSEVSQEELKWAYELMRENVKSFYISGGWGWNDKEKWNELTHDSACYLVARDSASQKPVGFINFRFDLEQGVEVVYCYEIHLSEEVRRKGLGKFLMQILELIGHRADMKKVMLTVFKENSASNHFFRDGMNYADDETSPLFCDPLNDEEYSYSILSKALVKPVKPAGPASQVTSAEGGSNGAQQVFVEVSRGGGGGGGGGGEKKKLKLPVTSGETLLQGGHTDRT